MDIANNDKTQKINEIFREDLINRYGIENLEEIVNTIGNDFLDVLLFKPDLFIYYIFHNKHNIGIVREKISYIKSHFNIFYYFNDEQIRNFLIFNNKNIDSFEFYLSKFPQSFILSNLDKILDLSIRNIQSVEILNPEAFEKINTLSNEDLILLRFFTSKKTLEGSDAIKFILDFKKNEPEKYQKVIEIIHLLGINIIFNNLDLINFEDFLNMSGYKNLLDASLCYRSFLSNGISLSEINKIYQRLGLRKMRFLKMNLHTPLDYELIFLIEKAPIEFLDRLLYTMTTNNLKTLLNIYHNLGENYADQILDLSKYKIESFLNFYRNLGEENFYKILYMISIVGSPEILKHLEGDDEVFEKIFENDENTLYKAAIIKEKINQNLEYEFYINSALITDDDKIHDINRIILKNAILKNENDIKIVSEFDEKLNHKGEIYFESSYLFMGIQDFIEFYNNFGELGDDDFFQYIEMLNYIGTIIPNISISKAVNLLKKYNNYEILKTLSNNIITRNIDEFIIFYYIFGKYNFKDRYDIEMFNDFYKQNVPVETILEIIFDPDKTKYINDVSLVISLTPGNKFSVKKLKEFYILKKFILENKINMKYEINSAISHAFTIYNNYHMDDIYLFLEYLLDYNENYSDHSLSSYILKRQNRIDDETFEKIKDIDHTSNDYKNYKIYNSNSFCLMNVDFKKFFDILYRYSLKQDKMGFNIDEFLNYPFLIGLNIDQINKALEFIREKTGKNNTSDFFENQVNYMKIYSVFKKRSREIVDKFDAHSLSQYIPSNLPAYELKYLDSFLLKYYKYKNPKIKIITNNWNRIPDDLKMTSNLNIIYKYLIDSKIINKKEEGIISECNNWNITGIKFDEVKGYFEEGSRVPLPQWTRIHRISGQEGFIGRFLPRNDPRGLFIGNYTDCCQRIGGAAEDVAIHSQTSKHAAVFIVEKNGAIIAQSYAFDAGNKNVIFDNIETDFSSFSSDYPEDLLLKIIVDIYKEAAQKIKSLGYKSVLLGANQYGITPQDYKIFNLEEADKKYKNLEAPDYEGNYPLDSLGFKFKLAMLANKIDKKASNLSDDIERMINYE